MAETNGTTPAEPVIASAEEFRRQRDATEVLTLPDSGLAVRVKRAHIAELAMAGAIPDHLTGVVLRKLGQQGGVEKEPPPATLREALRPNAELIDAVCCATLVEPRMVPADTPVADHPDALRPSDVPWRDREHLYLYACRLVEASGLARFRGEPARDLDSLADGAQLPDAAE